MRGERLKISGGFLLLLGWFGWIQGWKLLFTVLSAAALHELGHCLVLWAGGASIQRLYLTACGAVLETNADRLSYGWELASVLAGPAVNLLCSLILLLIDVPWAVVASGAHLVLCCFNLLPLRPLDGGRALQLLISWCWGPYAGEFITRLAGLMTGVLFGGGLLWLMGTTRGNLWLLPAAAGLFSAAGREWCRTGDFL